MSHVARSTSEFHDVAARVIAAAEYFKSAGQLPDWARAELREQAACDAAAAERHAVVTHAAS